MNDFDNRVAGIGRRRAIAFFVPRLAALAVLGVVLAALLAGCAPTTGDQSSGEVAPASIAPYFYKDRITGCEYLSTRNEQGLAPRIAADGKTHAGCKAVVR